MKTIGFILPSLVIGGVETVLGNTIDALGTYTDYKVVVFVHSPILEPYWQHFFAERPNVKLNIILKSSEKFERFKGRFGFPLENIRKIVFGIYKRYQLLRMRHGSTMRSCDVIIDYCSGLSAQRIRKVKKPKLTWIHCSIKWVLEHNIAAPMPIFDKIVCISDTLLSEFANEFPQYADKLVRIYNPVDYHKIRKLSETGAKFNGKYFLCVGRLDQDKDISTIIHAFNDFWVRENKPDIKMVFIGDGNIADDMKKMAESTDAHDQFVFLGKIPQPYGYMRGALAHILSSFSEGLPTVLIEAMATGTLNISSNCPSGPHEILLDGDAGILFEPGNADELANAMSNVWNGRVDITAITKCATESLQRFNPEKIINNIVDLIKETNTNE